jgi:hypothetical protein
MIFLIIGYLIGRIGHVINYYYTNNLPIPHHWIIGYIIMLYGLKKEKNNIMLFGIGLIISDFNDLLNFKIFGSDNITKLNFFGVD